LDLFRRLVSDEERNYGCGKKQQSAWQRRENTVRPTEKMTDARRAF